MQKKPTFVPDSEAFNSYIEDGFLVPGLKDGSEASKDEQADNVSNEAFCVIGLRGSGDKVSRYLQDWAVAKVALSCHTAFDMLCQEVYTKLKGDVAGLDSERVFLSKERK